MSVALHEATRVRLVEFRDRAHQIGIVRALARSVSSLTLIILALTGTDIVFQPDRLMASLLAIVAYGMVLGVLVWIWKPLLRKATLRSVSREIEAGVPALRERLLSAVELAEEHESLRYTSEIFRAALQQEVAVDMVGLQPRALLPWQRVRRDLLIAGVSVIALTTLMTVNGAAALEHARHAFWPWGNWARTLDYTIEVIAPVPPTGLSPRGDQVRITAQITGPTDPVVRVELNHADGTRNEMPVPAATSSIDGVPQYSAAFAIRGEWAEYRVWANQDHTPWYRRTCVDRPIELSFAKRYRFPAYTQLEPLDVSEDHGDLQALNGTQVTLEIAFNVTLAKAAIVLVGTADSTTNTIPLTPRDAKHWTAELTIDRLVRYRLELEAAESHLTNVFGRTYTITPIEDRPPRVRLSEPATTTVVVTPDTVLALAAEIEDELPVATTQQWVRDAQTDWQPLVSTMDVSGQAPQWLCQWNWDLLGSNLSHGTLLRTKLIVTDRKGQQGESQELEIVIARAKLEAALAPATDRRIVLVERLFELTEQAQEREKIQQKARQALDGDPQSSAKLRMYQDALRTSCEQWQAALHDIRNQLAELAREESDVLRNEELRAIELALAQIERQSIEQATQAVSTDPPADDEQHKQQVERAYDVQSRLEQARNQVGELARSLQRFATHEVLTDLSSSALAAHDFSHATVEAFRQAAANAPPIAAPSANGDPAPRQPYEENFRRQQAQLATFLRALGETMTAQSQRVREQAGHRLRDSAQQVVRVAQRIEKALLDEEHPQAVADGAAEVLNDLQTFHMIGGTDSSLPQDIQETRKQLHEQIGLVKDALQRAADTIAADQPPPNQDGTDPSDADRTRRVEQALQALRMLTDHRQSQFAQQDSDAAFAADLGDAQRAAQDILTHSTLTPVEQAKQLRELAKALHQIETAQLLTDTQRMVEQLSHAERWANDPVEQRFDHPKSWDSYSERVERVATQVRAAEFPEPAIQAVDGLRWPEEMQRASTLIGPRRWDSGPMSSAAEPLEDLAAKIARAQAELQKTVEQAREIIRKAAPTVSEMAERAAEQAETTADQLVDFSQQVAEGAVPDFRADTATQVARESAAIAAHTQPLREAFADLAARQDLLDAPQRQRARDADTAQAIVDAINERIQESYAATAEAPRLEDTASNIAQAAETTQQSSEMFRQLAEHFAREQSAAPERAADSNPAGQTAAQDPKPATLEELLDRLSASEQLADAYQDAERLAQLAGNDPATMLQALEQELPQNPAMQRELSRIARRTAENSVDRLQQLAKQETDLQSELEDSSPAYHHQKELLRREVEAAVSRADAIARRMQYDLNSMLDRAEAKAGRDSVQAAHDALRDALERLDEHENWQTAAGLQQAAEELAAGLRTAEQATRSAEQNLSALAQTPAVTDEKERKAERERMENWQREMLEGRRRTEGSLVEQRERQRNQARQELEELANRSNQARSNADSAAQQAQQNPSSADAATRAQGAELEAANAERARQLAANRLETAEQQLKQAQTRRDQMNERQPPALDQPHPVAQLGQNVAAELSEEGARTAGELEQLAGAIPNWQNELAARRGTLAHEHPQQQQVGRDVQSVGRDLDRAAAHEQRLGNSQPAETMAARAQQVHQVAEGSVQAAEEGIRQAAGDPNNLSALEAEQAAANDASTRAQQSLSTASTDLAQQSSALQEQLEHNRGDFASTSENTPHASDNNASQERNSAATADRTPLNMPPQAMAHLLDQLDRQLREPAANAGTPRSESAADAEPPARMSPQSLSQAARALAARMQQSRQATPDAARRAQAAQARNQSATATTSQATAAPHDSRGVARPDATLLDPNRIDASGWSKLRQQVAEESTESTRESVAPGYRQQVDAYFRAVAEQSNK